jgi:glucose 1-dehydrogenase
LNQCTDQEEISYSDLVLEIPTTCFPGWIFEDNMRFANRVAIVTRGARGIGLARVKLLVDEGAKVVFGDLRREEGTAAAKDIRRARGEAVFVKCDVTSARSIQGLIDRAVKAYGGIDTGIHVAAIWYKKVFLEESEADFDAIIRVNLKGTFLFGQTLARYFVRNSRPGSIGNFSSIAEILADGGQTAYVASKAAVGLVRLGW